MESFFAKVDFGDSNTYVIGSIYRPATVDISLFIDSMYAIFDVTTRKIHNTKCVFIGDMNIENQLASEKKTC